MAFVDVEASALLIREQRFDLKAPLVETDRLFGAFIRRIQVS
jgi:hypothetical protein